MLRDPSDNVRPFRRRGASDSLSRPAPAAVRLALWELPGGCLCPVVGTCLSVHELRQLLDELFEGSSHAGDFELHAGSVRECGTRNKLSELLQATLDERYAAEIERLAGHDDEGLAEAWEEAEAVGDVAAALWAIVGHPACSGPLRERMLCEIHMAQHHALASQRRLLVAREQLESENQRLQSEVLLLRARCDRLAPAPEASPSAPVFSQALRRAFRAVSALNPARP